MKNRRLLILLLICALSVHLVACAPNNTEIGDVASEEKTQKAQEVAEKVFVDDENCTFKITGIEPDNLWGYTLKVDLENKTDKNLMFSLEDVSVNGYMCDPFWANSVQAGKKAKSDISFSVEEFEELGITDVEEIEFTLSVYDEDNWDTPHFVEETFTYIINK